ncbi:MAG: hypothetical protein K0Q70_390 [Rhodospirillales bacterium]|nr:hypothetical protein [Rhodospirillales bacterium]
MTVNKAHIDWEYRTELERPSPAPAWFVALKVAEAASLRERARSRWRPSRTMFAVYFGLLVLMTGFGVFSAVQWERKKDAETYAVAVKKQNVQLAARLADRDAAHADLLQLVELAAGGNAHATLAQVQLLQRERPDLARSAVFQRLRQSVQDLASAGAAPRAAAFETASGGN